MGYPGPFWAWVVPPPPSLFSHCFPPPDPEQERGSGASTSHQQHPQLPTRSAHPEHPNGEETLPFHSPCLLTLKPGSHFPSLPAGLNLSCFQGGLTSPARLCLLQIPHDDFQPWLLPVEHLEPGTPLREGDKGDKAGQETGDGAGKAEETPPGSRICRLSFLLHGLGLNPHIPMGTLSQWGPRGSVGTPHPHWSRGGPGFSPGQGLQDSRKAKGAVTEQPSRALLLSGPGWPQTVGLGSSCRKGRAFLTTAAPDPYPGTNEGNLVLPAPAERKRAVTPSCDTQL